MPRKGHGGFNCLLDRKGREHCVTDHCSVSSLLVQTADRMAMSLVLMKVYL